MKTIKQRFENISIKRNAKKYGRTFEQQRYRDRLAKSLKALKKEGKSIEELNEILSKKQSTIEYAENQISCGRFLNNDIAVKLISGGNGKFVVENLEKFKGLDYNGIAMKFIECGNWALLVENLEKFDGLDYDLIANELIKRGCWQLVKQNLTKFESLDETTINHIYDIERKERKEREKLENIINSNFNMYQGFNGVVFAGVEKVGEIGGKQLFKIKDNDGYMYLIWGNSLICGVPRGCKFHDMESYNEIGKIWEVDGQPFFIAKSCSQTNCYGGYSVFLGDKEYLHNCEIGKIIDIGGKPCFKAWSRQYSCYHKDIGYVVHGNWVSQFFEEIGPIFEFDGKPLFCAKIPSTTKHVVAEYSVRGTRAGDSWDVKIPGYYQLFLGDKIIGRQGYDNKIVYDGMEGGKPVFKVSGEETSGGFYICDFIDKYVGDKFIFRFKIYKSNE